MLCLNNIKNDFYRLIEGNYLLCQVLDLSFNDFKGPGFEPLENCRVLQVCCLQLNLVFYVWMILSHDRDKKVKRCEYLFNNSSLKSLTRMQQLYLAGNQITSLASLPQLPNLEAS